MKTPKVSETAKRAIEVLSDYTEERLNPIEMFETYAKNAGDVSEDYSFSEPLYPTFEDYDYLHDTSRLEPIYLDSFDFRLEEDREALVELTRMEFEGNTFDNIAKCSESCGHLRGNYLINSGRVCTECGNEVSQFINRGDDTILWIRKPEGVKAFINIGVYSAFFNKVTLGTPRVEVPKYFLDSKYRRDCKKDSRYNRSLLIIRTMMSELGIKEPNLNTFYENCDAILDWIFTGNGRSAFSRSVREINEYIEFWKKYRDVAFCNYIKAPYRYMNVLEKSGREIYSYDYQTTTAQIYYSLGDCLKSNELHKLTAKELDKNVNIVGRNLVALAAQYRVNNNLALFGKVGLNRKHVCSGSLPFTGRSVITSVAGIFSSDELIVPWRICLSALEIHITSYLYRKGYTPYEVNEKILNAAYAIDPEIDEYFKWVEDNNKVLVQTGRNPSIEYLSLKTFKLRANRCLDDESIKISILAIGEQNADFDGENIAVSKLF